MKIKKNYAILTLSIVLVIGYIVSTDSVNTCRESFAYKLRATVVPAPIEVVKAMSGEFKGLVADYLLLEAASFVGSNQPYDDTVKEWDAVARLLKQSNKLDPYFRSTYLLAQGSLPWRAKKYDDTLEILENSKKHLIWDWYPGFLLGFNHYYFLNDPLTASDKLVEASKIPGAPVYLAVMAAGFSAKAGQIDTAIAFLTFMYEETEEESSKEEIKKRILALKGVKILEDAFLRFQLQYARLPYSLSELVSGGILPELPKNPYQRYYTLKEGRIYW